ncbi:MAG: transcription termination factor NusA [Candidatus Niyogibacteria bacterium RIFCSPLOWO2_01_FULL_45_48]|uniref:Transcription termination/antitermination protein NusA n=1 Tax=Candidatus Niyogibacteria bacterium RIFCSPLOWO2_01_FULL_45_48 TaxID=1801724 RepID=A0A1G2EZW2_9BACT|nr:MAG: transcription termination factor NusA [Candidatus Niyogibacteria bacterium RIFCSPLOWO2_01_FULL_45_48]
MLSDLKTFQAALEQLEAERGISKEKIIETIEMALAAAYKKDYGKRGQIVKAKFDASSGKTDFWQVKIVVDESMLKPEEVSEESDTAEAETPSDEPRRYARKDEEEEEGAPTEEHKVRFNPERHIMIDEAKKIKKGVGAGEELIFNLESKGDYGRIAAQTAKQVIIQRIREAERESVFDEFKKKEGGIISGIVQRVENRSVFLDLGRITAILPQDEQMRGERYRIGERIKALLYLVEKNPRGTNLYLSRTHPQFLVKLFEMEVPEMASGVVEIKNVAREPGARSKIAVFSSAPGIDPVGSAVGQKGVRVSTVIAELGGEKIDIAEWSDDPEEFVSNSLSPAKILDVEIDKKTKTAMVTVAEDQLSLAIGRGGQNVRLAAKLTGWKIDIRSRKGESIAQATEEGEVSGENIEE